MGDVCCGEKDETTPINKARDLHDTLEMISLSRKQQQQQQQQQQRSSNTDSNNNSSSIEAATSGRSSPSPAFSAFQTSFRALENSAHLPMEEIGDSRDAFESYVVQTLERRVEENFVIRV